jgi:Tol biopolymer transport system component
MADRKIVPIGEPSTDRDIGSISWAPDGNSFVFDRAGKVFIYDLASQRTLAVADGSDPTWSPDGKQIALRTGEGKAAALDPTTLRQRELLGGRKILSPIRWSPDSKYVVATEPASLGDKIFHGDPTIIAITRVYKLSNMSSVTVEGINFDSLDDRGRWWFWIRDYSGFLQGARADLPLRCGQQY